VKTGAKAGKRTKLEHCRMTEPEKSERSELKKYRGWCRGWDGREKFAVLTIMVIMVTCYPFTCRI
jgi:hypothetical protein